MIMETFAGAFGLHTNIRKCQFTPIQCSEDQVAVVKHHFPCQLVHFPCKYLSVPLSIYKRKKSDLQTLVDSVADHLPIWKSRLMSRAGRTALTKITLSAILIHVSITVVVAPRIYQAIEKLRRAFIWIGSNSVRGGQCLVTWSRVARPVTLGGLGVIDLTTMGYTLHLRWEWLAHTEPHQLWATLPSKPERAVRAMFDASVTVHVASGAQTLLW
jgi:hypothetical protein